MLTCRQRLVTHAVVILILFFSLVAAVHATDGWASTWQGPGAATPDCRWPWDDCRTRTVTALETGRSLTVTPTMFCACYVPGVAHPHRLIDLPPDMVLALGLDPTDGLWRVSVQFSDSLPNTSVQ